MMFRPLLISDMDAGFTETLSVLREVDQPKQKLVEIYQERLADGMATFVFEEEEERVVATGAVLLETKFYRGGRKVAHIEDVAVHPDWQGQGYGSMMMTFLKAQAVAQDCYKMILDCSDKNVPFYERNGYCRRENQMRLDLSHAPVQPYQGRPLEEADFENGFVETLSVIRPVDVSKERFNEIFKERQGQGVHTFVIDDAQGSVVATGSLLIEPKFYHEGRKVAHIEDVAVHPDCQRQGYGSMMMSCLKANAAAMNCYKMILDCSDKNMPFYERSGFKPQENQMRLDL